MKAIDYVEKYKKEITQPLDRAVKDYKMIWDKVVVDMIRDLHKETFAIMYAKNLSSRNPNQIKSVIAEFKNQNEKWNAICKIFKYCVPNLYKEVCIKVIGGTSKTLFERMWDGEDAAFEEYRQHLPVFQAMMEKGKKL